MEPLGVKHQEAGGGEFFGTGAGAWLSGMDSTPPPRDAKRRSCAERGQRGRSEGEATGSPDSRRALSPIHMQSGSALSQGRVAPSTTAPLPCASFEHVCIHSATFVMSVLRVRMGLDSGPLELHLQPQAHTDYHRPQMGCANLATRG